MEIRTRQIFRLFPKLNRRLPAILPSQCINPALPIPLGKMIVVVGPYLPYIYRIIPMAEMQHPPVCPSQIRGLDGYVFQGQEFDDKPAVILPDTVHRTLVRAAESASTEDLSPEVVSPRALIHHFIDKQLHCVDPVAPHFGKTDRGRRQRTFPAYQEVIHPDDLLLGIIEACGYT